MARIKSLIIQVRIDAAGKAHDCQANALHQVKKGDLRLKVRNGRGWDHYCRVCAETIIDRDIQKLICEHFRHRSEATTRKTAPLGQRGLSYSPLGIFQIRP